MKLSTEALKKVGGGDDQLILLDASPRGVAKLGEGIIGNGNAPVEPFGNGWIVAGKVAFATIF